MKLNNIMMGSENPKKLADFYNKVIGDAAWHDGDWYGYQLGGGLLIGPHSEVKGKNKTPGRIMIGFETKDVKAEFARIKELGGEVVAEPYNPGEDKSLWLATIADPDGNYLQLASPWEN